MIFFPLAVLAGLVVCVWLARRSDVSDREIQRLEMVDRLLDTRVTPIALGVANALLVWWWMGWQRTPVLMIQDEAAYLLQAELFARGRWTGMAPPLPEFFAQMHVLTEPVLASKYPPGLSLLLAPFVAIGFATLGPMTFAAVTGALIFVLARRVAGGPVALLTWILWSSGSAILRYQGSLLSQTATIALWLGTLYFVLEYHTRRRGWSLVALGGTLGVLAITRPVTALALALPVGVVVMRDVWRSRAWRSLTLAAIAGSGVVAVLPVQNHMTTGDWRLSPLVAYSQRYTPFDFPGFGYSATRALAPLPPDLDSVRTFLTQARRQHTLPALPATLGSRAAYATLDIFSGWRTAFLLFAIVGLFAMPAAGIVAVAASTILLLAYAFHAHWSFWTAYYVEGYPAIVFASATGLWAFAEWMVRRHPIWKRLPSGTSRPPRVRAAVLALCAFVVVSASIVLPRYRAAWQRSMEFQQRFANALSIVERESPRSIVFVDYGPGHDVHASLVRNVPDLHSAKTWIAHERGPDDLRLLRLAPDRRAYIFRADKGRLTRLPSLAELEKIIAMRGK